MISLVALFLGVVLAGGQQSASVADSSFSPAAGGGGDSVAPVLSPNARFVLFTSVANNLAATSSNTPFCTVTSPRWNVFLRDRTNGMTTLVSVNPAGNGAASGDSIGTGISTNGRYALFESRASDLVPGDTNQVNDVFVRDLLTGTTHLVSVDTNGLSANGESWHSAMTPDGRCVAFVSLANNLVTGDTNRIADVFLRDLQTQTTTLLSVGAKPTNSASPGGSSESPSLTPDGRFVAFFSTATNLVAGVTNSGNVYVRDVTAELTYDASSQARSVLPAPTGATNFFFSSPEISEDGQCVAYLAHRTAGNSVAGVVIRYSLAGAVDVVHRNAFVPPSAPYGEGRYLAMTPDGRFIVFLANTNAPVSATNCVQVWDHTTGESQLVSGTTNDMAFDGAVCGWPTIDPSGRYVAFLCSSNHTMVTNVLMGDHHLFVRDLQSGDTRLASAGTNGVGNGVSFTSLSQLSDNGRHVAFQAGDGNLVSNDGNRAEDVFQRDLDAGVSELISARAATLPSLTPIGDSGGTTFGASLDGRHVVFASDADNLVGNDTNRCRDVFVRDMLAGVNHLVSAATNGWSAPNATASEASISADGRYVAFSSSAPNLVGNDTNNLRDVFLRDLWLATTTLVSVRSNSPGSGNGESFSPVLSPDGHRVLFQSKASNLAPVSTTTNNLFLRDLQTSATLALTASGSLPIHAGSMSADGNRVAFGGNIGEGMKLYVWDSAASARIYTNAGSGTAMISISGDGNRLAYSTSVSPSAGQLYVADLTGQSNWLVGTITGVPSPPARIGMRFSQDGRFLTFANRTALVSPDFNNAYDVYLYDLQTRSNVLVSRNFTLTGTANAASDFPDISPDGRFVAYRSTATNVVPDDNNEAGDVFLFDRTTGRNTLLTTSRLGAGAADGWSFRPQFTGNGRRILFQSRAADLAAADFNHDSDVFAFALFFVDIAPGPILCWPVAKGETYRVEFRDAVNTGTWQTAGGSVSMADDWAHYTDPSPSAHGRFYRIVTD